MYAIILSMGYRNRTEPNRLFLIFPSSSKLVRFPHASPPNAPGRYTPIAGGHERKNINASPSSSRTTIFFFTYTYRIMKIYINERRELVNLRIIVIIICNRRGRVLPREPVMYRRPINLHVRDRASSAY